MDTIRVKNKVRRLKQDIEKLKDENVVILGLIYRDFLCYPN